jgi:hypothetical protein
MPCSVEEKWMIATPTQKCQSKPLMYPQTSNLRHSEFPGLDSETVPVKSLSDFNFHISRTEVSQEEGK